MNDARNQPPDRSDDAPSFPASARLVVRVTNGIGNRLAAFVSALVIAEHCRVPLQVIWPSRERECPGAFGSLFGRESIEAVDIVEDATGNWINGEDITATQLLSAFQRGETVHLLAFTIFGMDLFAGWEFHEHFRARLMGLHPAPGIADHRTPKNHPRIGLHLRFTDHFPCTSFTPRWCYRVAAEEIRRRYPGESVFICSDSPAFAAEIAALLAPATVLSTTLLDSTKQTRTTLTGTQAALSDLWALSHCSVILSSPHSSFAAMAQTLGGGQAIHLAVKSETIRHRQAKYAWAIGSKLVYDRTLDRWNVSRTLPMSAGTRLLCRLAVQLTRPWYQDRPFFLLQWRLRRRLRRFLASPSLLGAAAQDGRPPFTAPSVS